MAELIITEKPKAAQMIAKALAEGKSIKKSHGGVPYYEITHKGKDIIIGCAVGHLFGLGEIKEKKKKGWTYPVFDIEWKPISEIDKGAAFSKKYLMALKALTKEADSFIVATDYDIEGETIGLNIIKYICKQKDANRMKFSTLTKQDLVNAYEKKSKHIDWGQANAGVTRHEMDWYWGINLSRALTQSIKKAGFFKILSSGRVQGPALKIIVEKEKEIQAFKSEPFWLLELKAKAKNGEFTAFHKTDKFWKKEEVEKSYQKSKGKNGVVAATKKSDYVQKAPYPFDLTTLQTESYRCLRINPKQTLEIAQDLYTSGYISYPRTSSQQLPESIGYKSILKNIAKQKEYSALCNELLDTELKPNNGKKTDPAHPAIFPTGEVPKLLDGWRKKVYDLIVRRFLATFAKDAVRQTVVVEIDINGEPFEARGITTIDKGWHKFYGQYANMKEEELPKMEKGEPITNLSTTILDKETQPPKRYTPASIIKELEKNNLGTKATRSEIIDTLYRRGYVSGQSLEATNLGIQTITTLTKYCPDIIDAELTRHFETEMEEIQQQKKAGESVLKEARDILVDILTKFKKKEEEIGSELVIATKESEEKANTIGKCKACSDGTLMIKKGKFGRFIACSKYPDCSSTYKLPAMGLIKPTEKECETCNHPMILVFKKAKQPQQVCINLQCPTKQVTQEIKEKPCPKCGEGTVILRQSIYGGFLACNKFPKCRHIERITEKPKKEIT